MADPFTGAAAGLLVERFASSGIEFLTLVRDSLSHEEFCDELQKDFEGATARLNQLRGSPSTAGDLVKCREGMDKMLQKFEKIKYQCRRRQWMKKVATFTMRIWLGRKLRKIQSDLRELGTVTKDLFIVETHEAVCPDPVAGRFVRMPIDNHMYRIYDNAAKLIEMFQSSPQFQSPEKPEIVCIHGMGGVGKTTLASLIHNSDEMKQWFSDGMFFILCGNDKGAKDLVNMIWKQMHGDERQLNSCNDVQRMEALIKELNGKRILFVIDDVWSHEQIEWMECKFPSGCAIIVTTRNRTVVRKPDVSFLVEPLEKEEAFKLFCRHAFGDENPPPSAFAEVARKMCEKCDGLPLALKVVGSSISQHDDREGRGSSWDRWLNLLDGKNQGEAPMEVRCDYNDGVLNVLRKSIDALADMRWCPDLLHMFLDLTGFPEDDRIPRDVIEAMWLVYPSVKSIGGSKEMLNTLMKLSLVEEHGDFNVGLHDLIRQAAIDKIKSAAAPRWHHVESGRRLGGLRSGSMQHQRLFIIDSENVTPDMDHCSLTEKFMWVQSKSVPHRNVLSASSFIMPNLVSCYYQSWLKSKDTSEEQLLEDQLLDDQLLEGISKSKKLRIMILLNLSSPLRFDYFLPFENLLVLWVDVYFSYINSEREFPSSIGCLRSLQVLVLTSRFSVMKLWFDPAVMENLTQLRILRMHRVHFSGDHAVLDKLLRSRFLEEFSIYILENGLLRAVPSEIGELTMLRSIEIYGCKSLKELPDEIGNLRKLVKLTIRRSPLCCLPCAIGELESLTHLDLRFSGLVDLPASISRLQKLTKLDLSFSRELLELPNGIGGLRSLTSLDLKGCQKLKALPDDFEQLTNLEILELSGCRELRHLPVEFGNLTNLRSLDLSSSRLEELPASVSRMAKLTELRLTVMPELRQLPLGLKKLDGLTSLDMRGCNKWTLTVPDWITQLTGITNLRKPDDDWLLS